MAQLVATLVAEIILCCKEVNTKTRAAAFELLVEIGHAMQAARSPPAMLPSADDAMGVLTPWARFLLADATPGGPCARYEGTRDRKRPSLCSASVVTESSSLTKLLFCDVVLALGSTRVLIRRNHHRLRGLTRVLHCRRRGRCRGLVQHGAGRPCRHDAAHDRGIGDGPRTPALRVCR